MKRVVIIGGGISGLTTALYLRDGAAVVPGGLDITILERGQRPGGPVRTDTKDGFTVEWGPNGFLDNAPETMALVSRLGLESELQRADLKASKRYIYRDGRLRRLPRGPGDLVTGSFLDLRGRLRILREPFVRTLPPPGDESVHDFAARRFGRRAADGLVDAMVSGVFAGDARRLSLASAFPQLAAMEAEHGSIARALRGRRGVPSGVLTSFRGGLGTWIDALAKVSGPGLRAGCSVASIEDVEAAGGAWRVTTTGGERFDADAVVVTTPAPVTATILEPLDAPLAGLIREIPTAPIAVVAVGVPESAVQRPLDGFGFLVPRSEGSRILGCLWDSTIFAGRAPAGSVLLRALVGGAHDPDAAALDNEELIATVRQELSETMSLHGDPTFLHVVRHPVGIAQYNIGHADRLARIRDRLVAHPGLWLGGNSYDGVSLNACVESAARQAGHILDSLEMTQNWK